MAKKATEKRSIDEFITEAQSLIEKSNNALRQSAIACSSGIRDPEYTILCLNETAAKVNQVIADLIQITTPPAKLSDLKRKPYIQTAYDLARNALAAYKHGNIQYALELRAIAIAHPGYIKPKAKAPAKIAELDALHLTKLIVLAKESATTGNVALTRAAFVDAVEFGAKPIGDPELAAIQVALEVERSANRFLQEWSAAVKHAEWTIAVEKLLKCTTMLDNLNDKLLQDVTKLSHEARKISLDTLHSLTLVVISEKKLDEARQFAALLAKVDPKDERNMALSQAIAAAEQPAQESFADMQSRVASSLAATNVAAEAPAPIEPTQADESAASLGLPTGLMLELVGTFPEIAEAATEMPAKPAELPPAPASDSPLMGNLPDVEPAAEAPVEEPGTHPVVETPPALPEPVKPTTPPARGEDDPHRPTDAATIATIKEASI